MEPVLASTAKCSEQDAASHLGQAMTLLVLIGSMTVNRASDIRYLRYLRICSAADVSAQ